MNRGIYGLSGPHVWESPLQAIAGGETTFALPIQRVPDIMKGRLVCVVAELNWQIGDIIEAAACVISDSGFEFPLAGFGYSRCGDGVRGGGLTMRLNALGSIYAMNRYSGGAGYPANITAASWNIKAMAIWFDP